MTLDELIARESIRDLVARYNANGDTGRFAQLFELFADDMVMELKMFDGSVELHEGLEAVKLIFTGTKDRVDAQGTVAGPAYIRHHTATLQIDLVDTDHANARCYFHVLTGDGIDHWGRYVDRFRRIAGTWKFSRRMVQVEGRSATSWMA